MNKEEFIKKWDEIRQLRGSGVNLEVIVGEHTRIFANAYGFSESYGEPSYVLLYYNSAWIAMVACRDVSNIYT